MADDDALLSLGSGAFAEQRVPVPDPTLMTRAVLQREIALLRERLDSESQAFRHLVENKFLMLDEKFILAEKSRVELKADRIRELSDSQHAQDIALERQRELLEVQLSDLQHALTQNRKLTDTKFDMAESQRDEQKHDAEKGVETARLSADKALTDFMVRYERAHDELFQRTEAALDLFRKQVDEKFVSAKEAVAQQNQSADRAVNKSEAAVAEQLKLLSTPINDLKDRIGKIEAMKIGANETRDDSRANVGTYLALAGLVLAIIAMIITNSIRISGH